MYIHILYVYFVCSIYKTSSMQVCVASDQLLVISQETVDLQEFHNLYNAEIHKGLYQCGYDTACNLSNCNNMDEYVCTHLEIVENCVTLGSE